MAKLLCSASHIKLLVGRSLNAMLKHIVSKRFGTKTSCNWRARKDFSEVGQNRDY